jgi:hypothetical protein
VGAPVASRQSASPQRADPQRAATRPAARGVMHARGGVGQLQRALGNRGMSRLLRSGPVQAKLAVGPVNDEYEREADHVAESVMRMRDPGAGGIAQRATVNVQRKCQACQEDEELQRAPMAIQRVCPECEKALQRCACAECKDKAHEHEDEQDGCIQAKASHDDLPEPSSELNSYVEASRGGGEPLPEPTRAQFEARFGHDFSDVRIHTDDRAAAAAAEIESYAFATGSDIHFGRGRFQPGTAQGDHLLAHELTHTIQQTGGQPLASADESNVRSGPGVAGTQISRTPKPALQRIPSAGEILDSLEDTVSDAADTVGGVVDDAVDSAGEGLAAAGDAVSDAAGEVASTAAAAGGAIVDAGSEAIDFLTTEAGKLALGLADALGASVTVTPNGLEIRVPTICPLDAITDSFKLDAISGSFMVPIGAIPIGTVAITGEVGITGSIKPRIDVQLGPICLNGILIVINPVTGSFHISGSVSATAAAALAAELTGGLRGAVSLKGVIPIGEIPVPIDVPLAGLEGGLAGLVRGIGAGTLTIGGALSIGGGSISMNETRQLDIGLAADLFAGAYGQIDVFGKNLCRIYWQPYEWHGDVAGSLGLSIGVTVTPGGSPSIVPTIAPPTFTSIPFSQIPLALSREGFSDDCPILDKVCEVLKDLKLLPSQNGGVWNPAGPFGPGPRLPGPLEAYQKNPGIPSGAECRGACGPDCDTCEPTAVHRFIDPATGDIWEYINFQDCDTNDPCREHDAAFDWAAAVHGETGTGAVIMPWHMAANIECTCNNLAGNCIAWIAGLPPYDGKMFFADTATLVGHGGGKGLGGDSCHTDHPNAPDCLASFPDRDAVLEEWGARNRIQGFHDCVVVADFTLASTVDCDGGPGNFWNCDATDAVSGQAVKVGIFECICCNDDDTSSSRWTEPQIVVDPTVMSEELILELCDRGLIPRVICIPFEDNVIGRFGNRGRDLNINPDTDPKSRLRPDDAPIMESFKRFYNRLDSWSIFIKVNHPELAAEFKAKFDIEARRDRWLKELKVAGDAFKESFRNVGNTDPEKARQDYLKVLDRIQKEIDVLNHEIATWFKDKSGTPGTIDEIIEEVHAQGTELWRAAWRRAILQVNRVLSILWPPAKQRVLLFVGQKRAAHPDKDLAGPVGELDYLGSLSGGFKGPPKQNIRFNPQSFDVDGFIEARPLSQYAVLVLGLKPKNGNIFASKTDIEPLNTFSAAAQRELVAKVEGYKDDPTDPFDVAIKTDDLPNQTRGKAATERLYKLREQLPLAEYNKMVQELKDGGFLTPDGNAIREELSESEADAVKAIMDKFDPQRAPASRPDVRTA